MFFKNPLYMIASAVGALAILSAISTVCAFLGTSVLVIAPAVLLLSIWACVAVAAKDPTHGRGYLFGAVFAAATIGIGVAPNTAALVFRFVVGALYFAAMWATYRVRRWMDIRRIQAHFRAFGI
jgi:hypothetical protein